MRTQEQSVVEELEPIERVRLALRGEEVDRVPISFWGHDYLREWDEDGLIAATIEFQTEHQWDFVKLNPRSTYYAEGWGARFRPSGEPDRGPVQVEAPVRTVEDLLRLTPIDPSQGVYREHLRVLRAVVRQLGSRIPILQTVFTPLSVLRYLVPRGNASLIVQWMTEAPEALHHALQAIAQTLAQYALFSLEQGAAGIFLATTVWATRNLLSEELYSAFALPYDHDILRAVDQAWFNVLHICQDHNHFDLLYRSPGVHALHWADRAPGNPSLAEGQARTARAVMGGVDLELLRQGPASAIAAQVHDALRQTQGRRVLIAAGCTLLPQTPAEHLRAAKEAIVSFALTEEREPSATPPREP